MRSTTSVLIVDDEAAVRNLLARWAVALGCDARTAGSAADALAAIGDGSCDLAVIDVMMPGHNGLWLASQIRRTRPGVAIVLATGFTNLLQGAEDSQPVADLLIKPFARDRFALAVDRARRWGEHAVEEMPWEMDLWVEVRRRTEDVCDQLRECAADEAARQLLVLASARTPDLVAHAERVAGHARAVSSALGVSPREIPAIEDAARYHDIGKIVMPEALLHKPCPLTAPERAIIRRHVDVGAEMLQVVDALAPIGPLVLATHEWFSGGGYPRQLTGTDIPLGSRIVAVCDAFDAMTQDRRYHTRVPIAEAVGELQRCAGVQFDPGVVAEFLAVIGRN